MSEESYSQPRRKRNLTDEDLDALRELLHCKNDACLFTQEEVMFVRDWLDTAKTAKSEVVRWITKMIIIGIGLVAGIQVAVKMGWFKMGGK